MNPTLRKNAKNNFEKEFFKLTNNFWKNNFWENYGKCEKNVELLNL